MLTRRDCGEEPAPAGLGRGPAPAPGGPPAGPAPTGLAAGRERWILHVDMDAFFASVEALDDPRLAGRPLIVGGAGNRGVVASCSYEARVYGVRSAMPSVQARRLCPQAVFVPGRYDRYAEVSRQMHAVFRRFTPFVEGISLDEAFLDVTGAIRLFGPPATIAGAIREQIRSELRLNCSVGVAPVKFLAKLASEAAKPRVGKPGRPPAASRLEPPAGPPAASGRESSGGPPGPAASGADSASPAVGESPAVGRGRGVYVVERGQELAFLHPHPIEALWGVGPATARRLRGLGFATIGDLAAVDPLVLQRALGKSHGRHLAALARGIDERGVEPERPVKSVSHEETYPTDRRDQDGLRVEILRMADAVASRLRNAGLVGRTVTLKVRYGDFATHTRSATEPAPTDSGQVIAGVASKLLSSLDLAPGVRLLGVGVSNLSAHGSGPAKQLSLDLEAPPAGGGPGRSEPAGGAGGSGRRVVRSGGGAVRSGGPRVRSSEGSPHGEPSPAGEPSGVIAAIDAIRRRFGPQAVGPAALVDAGGLRVKRTGDSQWGPGGASRADPAATPGAGSGSDPPPGAPSPAASQGDTRR